MALALNNPRRLIYHYTEKAKRTRCPSMNLRIRYAQSLVEVCKNCFFFVFFYCRQISISRLPMVIISECILQAGYNPEDLPKAMNDREKWQERVRDIRAGGTTWWWWWWYYKIISMMFTPTLGHSIVFFLLKIHIINLNNLI